jgi:hypothetical protein
MTPAGVWVRVANLPGGVNGSRGRTAHRIHRIEMCRIRRCGTAPLCGRPARAFASCARRAPAASAVGIVFAAWCARQPACRTSSLPPWRQWRQQQPCRTCRRFPKQRRGAIGPFAEVHAKSVSAWFSFSSCGRGPQWPARYGAASPAYCLNQTCADASALVHARPRSSGLFDPFWTKIPPSLAGTVQPSTLT